MVSRGARVCGETQLYHHPLGTVGRLLSDAREAERAEVFKYLERHAGGRGGSSDLVQEPDQKE